MMSDILGTRILDMRCTIRTPIVGSLHAITKRLNARVAGLIRQVEMRLRLDFFVPEILCRNASLRSMLVSAGSVSNGTGLVITRDILETNPLYSPLVEMINIPSVTVRHVGLDPDYYWVTLYYSRMYAERVQHSALKVVGSVRSTEITYLGQSEGLSDSVALMKDTVPLSYLEYSLLPKTGDSLHLDRYGLMKVPWNRVMKIDGSTGEFRAIYKFNGPVELDHESECIPLDQSKTSFEIPTKAPYLDAVAQLISKEGLTYVNASQSHDSDPRIHFHWVIPTSQVAKYQDVISRLNVDFSERETRIERIECF